MKILLLDKILKSDLHSELQNFESSFYYPLGKKKFRISHGDNYTAFYESMGDTICLIAVENRKVLGTFSCAIRKSISCKTKEEKTIAYLGDLKILKSPGIKSTYFNLAKQMIDLVQVHTNKAISVVMHGNVKTPSDYTGRLCIPKFKPLYDIQILRFNTNITEQSSQTEEFTQETNLAEFLKLYHSFSEHDYFLPGELSKRSITPPIYLASNDKNACGLLEDTRKGKILFNEANQEILSAHLSYFEYANLESGISLIKDALRISYKMNYPGLFVCMPIKKQADITSLIQALDCEIYGATVYGSDSTKNMCLNINTSEI